jgi:hypothetical protein
MPGAMFGGTVYRTIRPFVAKVVDQPLSFRKSRWSARSPPMRAITAFLNGTWQRMTAKARPLDRISQV